MKVANFEKIVDVRQNTSFDSTKYNLVADLASPEPGAGLIRDMPELLAPTELYVYANRGAVKVFALDEDGLPKLKPEEKGGSTGKRKSSRRGGMGLAGGGRTKKGGGSAKQREAEEKKKAAEIERLKGAGVAGGGEAKADENKDEPEELPSDNPDDYIQENTGFRMVTMVGKFDHKRQRELYAKALKVDLASANPHYLRLDVERQKLERDGTWSNWTPLDRKRIEDFMKYRKTTLEEEWVPQDSRIDALVDPLPHFEVGYWVGRTMATSSRRSCWNPRSRPRPRARARAEGRRVPVRWAAADPWEARWGAAVPRSAGSPAAVAARRAAGPSAVTVRVAAVPWAAGPWAAAIRTSRRRPPITS